MQIARHRLLSKDDLQKRLVLVAHLILTSRNLQIEMALFVLDVSMYTQNVLQLHQIFELIHLLTKRNHQLLTETCQLEERRYILGLYNTIQ